MPKKEFFKEDKKIFGISINNLIELMKINLLYTNPIATDRLRDKFKKEGKTIGKSFYKSLILKNILLSTLIVGITYTFFFIPIRFDIMPMFFDVSLAMWLIMSVILDFTIFYNIFYNNRDIESYLPLPVSSGEIFLSKAIIATIGSLEMLTPALSIFILFFLRNKMGVFAIVVYSSLGFLMMVYATVLLNMLIMQAMARISVLSKFKNSIITAMSIGSTVILMVFVIGIQIVSRKSQGNFNVTKPGELIQFSPGPISGAFLDGRAWQVFVIVGGILMILSYLLYKSVNGNFISLVIKIQGSGSSNIKHKRINNNQSLFTKLIGYNLSLVKDPTMISQLIVVPSLFPLFIILPGLITYLQDQADIGASIAVVSGLMQNPSYVFVASIAISIFFNGLSNGVLASLLFSLERENYYFLKATPLSPKTMFQSKLVLTTALSMVVPFIFIITIGVIIKSYAFIFVAMIFNIIATTLINAAYLTYDYNHMVLDWQNINDIISRNSKAKSLLQFFITIIIVIAIIVLMVWLLNVNKAIALAIGFLFYLIVASILYIYSFKTYKNIEN